MIKNNRLKTAFVILFLLLSMSVPSLAQQTETPVFCPRCGAELPLTAKFCTECGAKLPTHIAQREHEEMTPAVDPAVPSEPRVSEPAVAREELPTVGGEPATDRAMKITAERVYDHATALFVRGEYRLAAGAFRQVVEDYPSTPCAEAAPAMIEACHKMAAVERQRLTPREMKSSSGSALAEGFVGGCLGLGAALALLAALASAAN